MRNAKSRSVRIWLVVLGDYAAVHVPVRNARKYARARAAMFNRNGGPESVVGGRWRVVCARAPR